MLTSKEYYLLKQPMRNVIIKIEILNKNNLAIGAFEGIAIDGNITQDGNSVYRRSGQLQMVFKEEYNLIPSPDSKIWFGNKCVIKVGLKDYSDETHWFDLGEFAMDEVELNLDKSNNTLSTTLKDSMSFFDGSLGGTLSHKIVIEADSVTINDAIKAIIQGLSKYSMENVGVNGSMAMIPYTIEKEAGTTIYTLLREILDLYMGFDFYFNDKGYLVVEKIKDRSTDPVIEDFDGEDKDFRLRTSTKMDFKNIKNAIYVWGRLLDDGTQITWIYRNKYSRANSTEMNNIADMEIGDICHLQDTGVCYVWNGAWVELDFKVIPMFNIENIGEKVKTISNDKLFTVDQAKLNAEYELTNHSNFAETVTFDCVPLYHLKPKNKIKLNINNKIKGEYLIDSISTPLNIDSPMSITCHKLYY